MENKNVAAPLFNRKDLLRFNSHELIFDILLVLWSELLLYSVVTRGKNLYQLLTIDQLAWSTVVITFVLSWYIFLIYYHLDKKIKNVWPSVMMFYLAIIIPFLMCIFGYRGIEGIIGRKPPKSVYFWTFFGTLFSIIAGSGFAYTEQGAEEGKSILLPRVEVLFLIIPIGTFYMSFYLGGRVPFAAVLAAGGAVLLILYLIHRQIKDRKEMKLSRSYYHFRKYMFPVIFFLVLCLAGKK